MSIKSWPALLCGLVAFGVFAQVNLPAGSGPGVHGANSPYAPLQARADVLAWTVLSDVKPVVDGKSRKILPQFGPGVQALDRKVQRIQGFMMPLEPGEKQKHFLLASVPLTCSFCLPGGPESLVEVKASVPVRVSIEPVVVQGEFHVLPNDPYGIYYRITEAQQVK